MKKILLPVDGSDCSLRAVKHVLALREQYRSPNDLEIHLLNVQPSLPADVGRFISGDQIKSFHHDQAIQELSGVRSHLDQAGVKYEFHISVGDPADTIVRFAKENGFQQIVMGTHGRGGVTGLLLGSVASKTLAQSPVPVLIVK